MDQLGVQHPLLATRDVQLQVLAERLDLLLFSYEPLVLLLNVLCQKIVLLHNLDDAADRCTKAADLLPASEQVPLHLADRLDCFPVGRIHAGLEYGWVVSEVGEDLLDQGFKVARRQHLDRAGGVAPVPSKVDARIVEVRRSVLRFLARRVGRHSQAADAALEDALE
ncbi:MAG: hypothetical protein M0Z94_07765 [Dehalococcoidales bacterium]|nr:hypothetical protein [Dehalococcoidales bacterium]